jgi:hypothetical protein
MASFGSSGAKDLLIRYHGIRGGGICMRTAVQWRSGLIATHACMGGIPKKNPQKQVSRILFWGVIAQ